MGLNTFWAKGWGTPLHDHDREGQSSRFADSPTENFASDIDNSTTKTIQPSHTVAEKGELQ